MKETATPLPLSLSCAGGGGGGGGEKGAVGGEKAIGGRGGGEAGLENNNNKKVISSSSLPLAGPLRPPGWERAAAPARTAESAAEQARRGHRRLPPPAAGGFPRHCLCLLQWAPPLPKPFIFFVPSFSAPLPLALGSPARASLSPSLPRQAWSPGHAAPLTALTPRPPSRRRHWPPWPRQSGAPAPRPARPLPPALRVAPAAADPGHWLASRSHPARLALCLPGRASRGAPRRQAVGVTRGRASGSQRPWRVWLPASRPSAETTDFSGIRTAPGERPKVVTQVAGERG